MDIKFKTKIKYLNNKLPVITAKKTANAATPVALTRVALILSLFNTILVYVLINKKNNRNLNPESSNALVLCLKTIKYNTCD